MSGQTMMMSPSNSTGNGPGMFVMNQGHHHHHLHQQNFQQRSCQEKMIINESNNHCVQAFESLRLQREQGRFADLTLSVQGREFPAHRCVLAACSPWFDSKLKMHKVTREHIVIDECKDYEIFYALLSYCYTGNIVIYGNNVGELTHLSNLFGMSKLRNYCCEYISNNLSVKNVHWVIDISIKYNIGDLLKQSLAVLHKNFMHIYDNDRSALLHYSANKLQVFLNEKSWGLPQELLLKFIAQWVGFDVGSRDDAYMQLLSYVNWPNVDTNFLYDHLENESLFSASHDALFSVLHVLHGNGIYLGPKFQEIYQSLQDKFLPDQGLDELNDSNSFLSQAINSAVKDLEHSVVDPDWLFQSEPYPTINSGSYQRHHIDQQPIMPNAESGMNYQAPIRENPTFDLEIVEQLISEEGMRPPENQENNACAMSAKHHHHNVSSAKMFDPKFRAISEAKKNEEEAKKQIPDINDAKYAINTPEEPVDPLAVSEDQDRSGKSMNQDQSLNNFVESISEQILMMGQEVNEQLPTTSQPIYEEEGDIHGDLITNQEVQESTEDETFFEVSKKKMASTKQKHDQQLKNKTPLKQNIKLSSNKQHVRKAKLLAQHRNELDGTKQTPADVKPEAERVTSVAVGNEESKKDNDPPNENEPKLKTVLKCDECVYSTTISARMKVHKKQHSKKSCFDITTCPFCKEFKSSWKRELREHMVKHHVQGPPFKCPTESCNYSAKHLFQLINHIYQHNSENIFKCDEKECDYEGSVYLPN